MRLEVTPDNLDVVEFRRVRLIEIERRRRAGGRPGPDIAVWSVSRGPWAHDVFGNAVATAVFQGASDSLVIDSVVELRLAGSARPVFSIAASAIVYPFRYSDDERFRREVAGAPEIGGEQRCAFGAHGVGRPGGMMDPFSRRAKPPIGARGTPPGMPGQRQMELFRLVRMRGIFDVGAEEENPAGERLALEGAAPADPFAPAVVL